MLNFSKSFKNFLKKQNNKIRKVSHKLIKLNSKFLLQSPSENTETDSSSDYEV